MSTFRERTSGNQFEVNVTGPLLLTQGIAKQMATRGSGRIIWVSSREGLNVNPFTGIYSASKHAVEAIAESMKDELQEFGVEVATMNPGPFLTGFNDRIFQTHESWEDDPAQRLFDYSKLAFPRAQFDPEPVYATLAARRCRRNRRLSQPRAEVDDRGDEESHRGPMGQEDDRRARHPDRPDPALLRHGARNSGLRLLMEVVQGVSPHSTVPRRGRKSRCRPPLTGAAK